MSDITCTICLFNTTKYTSIKLKCDHIFHSKCIKSLHKSNSKLCPNCREVNNFTDLLNRNDEKHVEKVKYYTKLVSIYSQKIYKMSQDYNDIKFQDIIDTSKLLYSASRKLYLWSGHEEELLDISDEE